MQIYSVARNVLGALGPKVKVPVLDSELKIPAECLRIVGALAKPVPERVGRRMDISRVKKKKQKIPQPQDTTRTAARACVIAV